MPKFTKKQQESMAKSADNMELVPFSDDNEDVLNLIFLPENDGKFLYGSDATLSEKRRYIATLKKGIEKRYGCVINYGGKPIGFMIAMTKNHILIGGLETMYTGMGLYAIARNTFIHFLNTQGVEEVLNDVDDTNANMKKFMEKQNAVKRGKYWHNYYDEDIPLVEFGKLIEEGR